MDLRGSERCQEVQVGEHCCSLGRGDKGTEKGQETQACRLFLHSQRAENGFDVIKWLKKIKRRIYVVICGNL